VLNPATGRESVSPFFNNVNLFRNREGSFVFSKILLCFGRKSVRNSWVFTVYQKECAFLLSAL
jgi:hypothetical protein